jgi:hypothetical protein
MLLRHTDRAGPERMDRVMPSFACWISKCPLSTEFV